MQRTPLRCAAAALLLAVTDAKPNKEVTMKFGLYNATQPAPVCDTMPINLQFSTDSCVHLDKSWALWQQVGVQLPMDVYMQLDCQGQSVSYKLFLDCSTLQPPLTFFCRPGCGGARVIDASTFLSAATKTIEGQCAAQCINIPSSLGGYDIGAYAGDYCLNIDVVSCVAMTPAPASPAPPPAPALPPTPPGSYQARVRISWDGVTECDQEANYTLPPFMNGACVSLIDTIGGTLGSLKSLGYDLYVRFSCHPPEKKVSYAAHLDAACDASKETLDYLPSGILDLGECLHTDVVIDPTVAGAPDMGVALRQPLFLEVDECWEVVPATPVPQTPAPARDTPVPRTEAPEHTHVPATPSPPRLTTHVPATPSPDHTPVPDTAAPASTSNTPVPQSPAPLHTHVPQTPHPPHSTHVPATPAPVHTPVPHTPSPAAETPVPATPSPVLTDRPSASPQVGTSPPSQAPGDSRASPPGQKSPGGDSGGGVKGWEIALFVIAALGVVGGVAFFVHQRRRPRRGGAAYEHMEGGGELNLVAD